MPSQTSWFNSEKTIIIHEIVGNWRVDDVMDEIAAAAEILETDKYQPKYFIFDMSRATGLPSGILAYRARYDEVINPNSVTIVVQAGRVIQLFVESMQRMGMKGTISFVDSIEAAVQTIHNFQQFDT